MTNDDAPKETGARGDGDDGDEALRALLRRSLGASPAPAPGAELLRGVQRKLRTRSRGKFFGDGWSISENRVPYAVVAVIMLVVIAVAFVLLRPVAVTVR